MNACDSLTPYSLHPRAGQGEWETLIALGIVPKIKWKPGKGCFEYFEWKLQSINFMLMELHASAYPSPQINYPVSLITKHAMASLHYILHILVY